MVNDFKVLFDRLSDARQSPPITFEADRQRTAFHAPFQFTLLFDGQFGRTPRRLPSAQTAQPLGLQGASPMHDGDTTDPQFACNCCVGELATANQVSSHSAAFFHLFSAEFGRFPSHAPSVNLFR